MINDIKTWTRNFEQNEFEHDQKEKIIEFKACFEKID